MDYEQYDLLPSKYDIGRGIGSTHPDTTPSMICKERFFCDAKQ
jgi:hypothetical protein